MANIWVNSAFDNDQKVQLMQRDALFDVADNDSACVPNYADIIRDTRSAKAFSKVPKVFLANDCIFNCAYCTCRASHECRRYENTPRELAEFSVRLAEKQGHGIFISSAIVRSPDYTQERIVEALRIIRKDFRFKGYAHAKVMPGADPGLIEKTGEYASRLSVNIEVAKSEGYRLIAKNKNKQNILAPMGHISRLIKESAADSKRFALSQTTQMMAGSAGEDDRTILRLSGALYRKYGLSRVYYTAFKYMQPAAGYEHLSFTQTPVWRMARLYQADRLMQLYGFCADEITPETNAFLDANLDPKLSWALRNLHLFPVEVNTAAYETLLRVPGIGIIFAKRILRARAFGPLTHTSLRALGVSLKRCASFITCAGRFDGTHIKNEAMFYQLFAAPLKYPAGEQLSFL